MGETGAAGATLNPLDSLGLALVGLLAHRSAGFDWAMHQLMTVDLLKLGVPVGLALYAWLDPRRAEPQMARASRVAFSLLGVLIAIGVGRAVQDGLPPRPRPRHALPWFDFPPLGDLPDMVEWSSFPSDHGVLVGALVAVAWAYSWKFGLASALWGLFVVGFPRLYFGYHYVTDLLAGAAFGALVVLGALRLRRPAVLPRTLHDLRRGAYTLVLLAFFAVGYECVTVFATTRRALGIMRDVVHALS
jgi:undecaprenyl-diphosphatase